MKTQMTILAAAVLAISVGQADAFGGKGGNASANQAQGQAQGQIQGQAQGQAQSQRNKQTTTVNVDTPSFTTGIHAMLGSTNNSPCGRTFFGIPASGHNCTVREEAKAIYAAAAPLYGERKAASLAMTHLCTWDASIRKTMVRAGICKPAK